jgi:hypothetical protein
VAHGCQGRTRAVRRPPAIAFTELAAEVTSEVRLLGATQAELHRHATEREACYRQVDPAGLARSLPGLATIGGPALVATMGQPGRFPRASAFRSFTGLAPKASETGQSDRKGQPISKAGNRLLRTTLVRAADHARRQDPQLARIYWVQMVERGKDHLGALCVVAAHLAERAWMVMDRGTRYVICDTDATPVTPAQAKAIIAQQWTVPEEVRRRRRSRKGKALNKSSPDMHMALKAQRGDPPLRPPVLAGHPAQSTKPCHPLDTQASIGNQPMPAGVAAGGSTGAVPVELAKWSRSGRRLMSPAWPRSLAASTGPTP